MYASLIAIALVGTPPTPTGTADRCVAVYYDHQAAAAVALTGSAAVGIYFATWRLTDRTLCGALSLAASNGVPVHVVYDGTAGTADAQYLATRGIVASGGTVYAASFARQIQNQFLEADGIYTLTGNYYYSATAVQIGSYSAAVSGTNQAFVCVTQFNSLISGGTITAANERKPPTLAPLIDDLGKQTAAINARLGGDAKELAHAAETAAKTAKASTRPKKRRENHKRRHDAWASRNAAYDTRMTPPRTGPRRHPA
jgi:hypothetical protein